MGLTFKVKGPAPKRMRQIEKLLSAQGIKELKKSVAASQAEEAINLIKQGFSTTTDPYGRPWKPKKRLDGRGPLHGPTGRLKGWKRSGHDAGGFSVTANVTYAAPNQSPRKRGGRLKRPRRRMIPSEKVGMPRRWGRDLAAAAREAMEDFLLV